jgi:AraC-like DNA-binding protein
VGFFPAITADAMLVGFDAMGLDRAAIARAAGLEGKDLRAQDAVLPSEVLAQIWEAAHRQIPREELPTEVALAMPFGAFGIIDYLAGSAETIDAGLHALADHFGAVASGIALEVSAADARRGDVHAGAWVRVARVPSTPLDLRSEEFTVGMVVGRFRSLAASPLNVLRVELSRKAPASPTRHESLLGAPATFGHAVAGVQIAPAALATRLRTADPRLRATLAAVARQLGLGGDKTHDLERAIRGRLRDLLAQGKPEASRVARSLGMSERTLHRRLSELGRSYQDIVDDFREMESEHLLTKGKDSLAQVALRLGFADQTAFHRAFKRWKGCTPREWVSGLRPS